jgi:hypothetical protein
MRGALMDVRAKKAKDTDTQIPRRWLFESAFSATTTPMGH